MLKDVAAFLRCDVFQRYLGQAENSRRGDIATLERKHRIASLTNWPPADAGGSDKTGRPLTQAVLTMADAPGIAPGSSVFRTDADLSQLNVRENWRDRTVIVFGDSEVHKPFCHGP